MNSWLRRYGWSLGMSALALIGMGWYGGLAGAVTTVVLIAIEVAFSIDNAIVNAKILEQLSRFWQQLFLTVGMVIAIVGMRLVFPVAIVAVSASLGFFEVIDLALHQPAQYAHYLELAHPAISAFGGGFLLTLALYFLLDTERKVHWLVTLERQLQRLGGHWWLAPLMAALLVGLVAIAPQNHHPVGTLRAGLLGILVYALIEQGTRFLNKIFGDPAGDSIRLKTGWAAFGAFMYLQLLDASFSFDGVLGAFAITNKIVLIVVGLGVGALWVRSLTVELVRSQALKVYVYLEHGAHYAILALALALLVSIVWNVPDVITGFVGLAIIAASFQVSRQARRVAG